ncbi:MAG TPA: hypothetical protein VLM79_17735 [Kofleriaceae bacterium]|nr:hypothetical protein [Kofleriaceae bacterium]
MANSENTAINDLIARATGRRLGEPPGPSAATEAAAQSPPPPRPLQPPRSMHTTYPPSMPVAAPFEPRPAAPTPTPYPAAGPRTMSADLAPPPPPEPLPPAPMLPAQPPAALPAPSIDITGDPSAAQSWRPSMASQDWSESQAGEHMVGTMQLRKPSELRIVMTKLVLPIALLVIAGVAIGGFVAFHGSAAVPASVEPGASAAPAEPTPPPSPSAETATLSAEAIVEPAKPPELVEVRIDSTPSGATVALIDRGKSQFVGTTPLNAAVDPSREYDLVFSWASRPSQQEHLDPRTTRRIAATLGKRPSPRADGARREGGEGTLMISSKPPCEIVIDGKPTGLTTPQRSIALSAGSHKVTLINRENDLRKAISVQITAGATEKVIEDLME